MVPANAEIVLECELMATEGWVHDEAPFGEFTGMYGGGLKHNVRAIVKAITHRKNGIFQYATIGCGHPWYTPIPSVSEKWLARAGGNDSCCGHDSRRLS
jgi:2,5-furandicarboxylate decarboxylase 1